MAFPTTFQDLQNAVAAKLRMNPSDSGDLSKIKDWLNQVYAQACMETEFIQTSTNFTLTAGTGSYDLTSVSSSIGRVKQLIVTSGGVVYSPLRQVSLERLLRFRQSAGGASSSQSPPEFYALAGYKQLELYPTPAAADTLTVWYVALPTALSANGDVPVMFEPYASKVLEYGALAEGADFKGDPAEGEYRQLFEVWMQKLRAQLHNRRGGGVEAFEWAYDQPFAPHDPSTDWYAG